MGQTRQNQHREELVHIQHIEHIGRMGHIEQIGQMRKTQMGKQDKHVNMNECIT